MEPTTIIMLVVIFVLIYMIYYYYLSSPSMLLSNVASARQMTTYSSDKLDNKNSQNFSYSVWFNINDWNSDYGKQKPLFKRGTCPQVYFAENTNDLMINVSHVSGGNSECSVKNVPIQKWVHLLISVYGKSMDTYINGKLVRTCILNDVPNIGSNEPIVLTGDGGFNGWVARFQYWSESTDPQTAWNIYKRGNGTSMFSNLFGSYGLKVSLINNGNEQNSFTL